MSDGCLSNIQEVINSSNLATAAIAHLNSTDTETSTFILDEVNAERPFFDGLRPMKKTVDGIKQIIGQLYPSKQQSTPISYQSQPQPTTTTTYNYQPQPATLNNPIKSNYYSDNTTFQSNPTWNMTETRRRDSHINSRLNRDLNFGDNRYFQNFKE